MAVKYFTSTLLVSRGVEERIPFRAEYDRLMFLKRFMITSIDSQEINATRTGLLVSGLPYLAPDRYVANWVRYLGLRLM